MKVHQRAEYLQTRRDVTIAAVVGVTLTAVMSVLIVAYLTW